MSNLHMGDAKAPVCNPQRNRPTNSLACAGDEDDFAVDAHVSLLPVW